MAINRFRRITPNLNTEYLPQVKQSFVPDLSGLESVMGGIQKEYDALQKPFELPNYLRNSATDVQAFKDYKNSLETARQNAIDSFKNNDFNGGRTALRNLESTLLNAKQPGGVHHELERGLTEYNGALKEITKTYNDPKSPTYNPYLFKLAKDRLDNNIGDFKDSFGEYRKGINGPILDKYIPQPEITKQLDNIIDNIEADKIVYGGTNISGLKGMSFKGLLERGELESINPNKVASVLMNSITPEMQLSIKQEGEAMGLKGDQSEVTQVGKGGKVEFADTILGRMVKGLVESKSFKRQTDKSKVLSDNAGLELFKHGLRKKEKDYEYQMGSETLRSQVFTTSGMPDIKDIKVNKNGKVVVGTKFIHTPGGIAVVSNYQADKNLGKGFRHYIEAEETKTANPAMVALYNRFKADTQNMSDKDLHKFIEDKYEEKRKALSVSDVTYTMYNEKQAKAVENSLLGTGDGLRNIVNKTLIVQENGKPPQEYTVKNLMDNYNIKDTEEFRKNLSSLGNVKSSNPLAASGEQLVWTNPKNGKSIQFLASNISLEDAKYKSPDFELASVAYNGTKNESSFVYTGIPALDQQYGKLQARADDIYESDQLAEQLSNANLSEEESLKVAERLEYLQNNPSENKFMSRKVELFTEDGINLSRRGPNSLYLTDIVKTKEQILQNARSNSK